MKTCAGITALLALSICHASAQVTSFESKGVILKAARDKTLPLIQIDEPIVKAGSPLIVTKDRCLFRGFASDVAGIGAVEMNGASLSLDAA
ncbi:MAG TPA: hypothetical protein VMM80_06610, partial [Bacteroidota bacterium]|nr:hypothetical protein [Bacteroidota bacterium]